MLDYIKPELTEHNQDNYMYAWHATLLKRIGKNVSMFSFIVLRKITLKISIQ